MEKMLISLLKEQGFEYIGIFDTEKNIWGYVKDGKFHFCHDNLVEVDRSTIGDNGEVLVITKTENKLSIVEHNQEISNYVVIDSKNHILTKKTEDDCIRGEWYRLFRINEKSIVISENDIVFAKERGTGLYYADYNECRYKKQIVIIDEIIEPQYGLWEIYGKDYIMVSDSETWIHNGRYGVKITERPLLWKHEDGVLHFLIVKCNDNNKSYFTVYTIYYNSNDIEYYDVEIPLDPRDGWGGLYNIQFYSDKYILIPIYRPGYSGMSAVRDRIFIISYEDMGIHAYPIFFNNNRAKTVAFTNDILIKEIGYTDVDDNDYEHYIVEDIELYDIRGNQLELMYNPVSEMNSHNPLYVPFSIRSHGMFNNIDKLYGVVRLGKQWAKVVIPPIFEKIEEISYELYKVQYGNYVGDNYHRFEGLYSITDGFFHAEANQLQYSNIIEGENIYTKVPEDIIVFSKKGKKGLIYNGKIVVDACLDEICGFDFSDKYVGEKKEWTIDEIKEKTKEYTPKCVILKNEGKYGLFINRNNIIMPIYDSIRCILITGENARYNEDTESFDYDKHAYFEVKQGDKIGIISDNLEFNKVYEIEYDNIELIEKYRHAAYFKVYKNGKVGLITSLKKHRESFSIPVMYENIDIAMFRTKSGNINKFMYIADGNYINGDMIKLIDAEHHIYIGFCLQLNCIAFKENGDYIFLKYPDGKRLIEKGRDEDGNYILSNKCTFDINDEKFIIKKEENDDQDDWDWRREIEAERDFDRMEIETGWQTAFGDDPESGWNID